jgi:hypothetical protein
LVWNQSDFRPQLSPLHMSAMSWPSSITVEPVRQVPQRPATIACLHLILQLRYCEVARPLAFAEQRDQGGIVRILRGARESLPTSVNVDLPFSELPGAMIDLPGNADGIVAQYSAITASGPIRQCAAETRRSAR